MNILTSFSITQPTEIHFGTGMVTTIPRIVAKLGARKPLLVIDPGLIRADLKKNITAPLKAAGLAYETYGHVDPEPGLKLADNGTAIAKKNNCDCVIGAGGGSAMDVAKAIAILLTNGGSAADYLGMEKIKKPGVPKIMVPTSAGTGAETTFTAVFINEATGTKSGMNGDHLYPEAAVLDPELTISLPPKITASTGIDALTHAIESYTSVQAHPIAEMYSIKAIRLINRNLRSAYGDGRNLEARTNMLLASLLAGKALAMAGVGLVHAMAYPLGGMFGIPHGLANAVLLPYVTDYNLIGNIDKHADLARLLDYETDSIPTREAANLAVAGLRELNQDIGIPESLQQLGVTEDKLSEMAEIALTVARPVANNPRQPTKEDIITIYELAMNGGER